MFKQVQNQFGRRISSNVNTWMPITSTSIISNRLMSVKSGDNLAGPGIGTYEEVEKVLPSNYKQVLNNEVTQIALAQCKNSIESKLTEKLNLIRVECPLIVDRERGVNDMLDRDGSRTPVDFYIKNDYEKHPINAQVVQAATKWKRVALKTFGLTQPGKGLFTDMRAIRKDYFLDHDHSCYVAQWDWEMTMTKEQRNLTFLFDVVNKLWSIFKETEEMLYTNFNELHKAVPVEDRLPNELEFVHCEELYHKYGDLGRKERETAILQDKKAVFLCGIGAPLPGSNNNLPHEMRAADYDDWVTPDTWPLSSSEYYNKTLPGLNGDILVWNNVTQRRHELSSMGIRVTKDTLRKQLEISNQLDFLNLPYHKAILNDDIPLSIGGGIGQSRTFMLLLRKAALGECEVSCWPNHFIDICQNKNIDILQ